MKQAQMRVEILDVMGDDISVVNAARVSFDKESTWAYLCEGEDAFGDPFYVERTLSEKDQKLLKYLATHGHWSPFTHATLSFRVKAPIFVARQLAKHQVGLSWNEVSRRYVDDEPEFYFPDVWRGKAKNVKQGSSSDKKITEILDFMSGLPISIFGAHSSVLDLSLHLYEDMLKAGVCPEQARMVLPQNTMTTWIWTGSLYAFARVCNQRLDSHSQKETQEIAGYIFDHLVEHFPFSTEVLVNQNSS